ncbi:flagellar biosynthesis anti-sigma factor FlgM [Aeromonas simiae]|nr:flagellar biosynthesis anti-sigma factor FlgM [Aeromonas simiae]MDO2948355.1 flagellar biosynthesis anti-sigma factor FlgM [Aeromonas simiae]MDO2955738.1 flagellar biosynthesis anti-sigma factor FlgM [Aeromonas simiae]
MTDIIMKIQRTDASLLQSAQSRRQEAAAMTASAQTPAPAQADISVQAQGLEQAHQRMQELSDVDMDKVEQISRALAEGTLELDMDALGRAIIEMHCR